MRLTMLITEYGIFAKALTTINPTLLKIITIGALNAWVALLHLS